MLYGLNGSSAGWFHPQKSSLLHDDLSDFIDGYTTQSQSDYDVILVQISLWETHFDAPPPPPCSNFVPKSAICI